MLKGTFVKTSTGWALRVSSTVEVGDRVIAQRKGQGAKYVTVSRIIEDEGSTALVAVRG